MTVYFIDRTGQDNEPCGVQGIRSALKRGEINFETNFYEKNLAARKAQYGAQTHISGSLAQTMIARRGGEMIGSGPQTYRSPVFFFLHLIYSVLMELNPKPWMDAHGTSLESSGRLPMLICCATGRIAKADETHED